MDSIEYMSEVFSVTMDIDFTEEELGRLDNTIWAVAQQMGWKLRLATDEDY